MATAEVATTSPAFQETEEQIPSGEEVATPESEIVTAQPVLIEDEAEEAESEETVDVDHEYRDDSVYSPNEPQSLADDDDDDAEEEVNNEEENSTKDLQVED